MEIQSCKVLAIQFMNVRIGALKCSGRQRKRMVFKMEYELTIKKGVLINTPFSKF